MDIDVKPTEQLVSEMKQLMEKKTLMEANIKQLVALLENEKGVGMDEPLVDSEGYPRADIDVVAVRHARHDLICLQNDHVQLMREMEEKLYEIHEKARIEGKDSVEQLLQAPLAPRRPFMRVRRVENGSPAYNDGIQADDVLVQFGRVSCVNFSQELLSSFVTSSVNKPVTVVVLRQGVEVNLTLTPRSWSGRGYLGKRPHRFVDYSGNILLEDADLQPLEKKYSRQTLTDEDDDKLNGAETVEKTSFQDSEAKPAKMEEDVEMLPAANSEQQQQRIIDLAQTSETPEIIFKLPLPDIISLPRENLLKENPWLKAQNLALVLWQPSPLNRQSKEIEENLSRNNEKMAYSDDDTDSGHVGDIEVDVE